MLCRFKGKSELGRASWLESLLCPQTEPKQAKWNVAVRTTLGGKTALNSSVFPLFSCRLSEWQNVPKASLRPGEGFLTVLTQAPTFIREPCHTMVWWGWWDEHRVSPWDLPTVKLESNCKRKLESVFNNFVSNPSGCLVYFFSFLLFFNSENFRYVYSGFGVFPLNYSQPSTHFPPDFISILYL